MSALTSDTSDGLPVAIEQANINLKHISMKNRNILTICSQWENPYSHVCGYVNARMSIAIVRATHLCLRGSLIPTSQMSRLPQWEDTAGLSLFRH
jgi:hypothetical protein